MFVTAVRHTTTINANITAYSTAVGPSSDRRNRFAAIKKRVILSPPQLEVERSLTRFTQKLMRTINAKLRVNENKQFAAIFGVCRQLHFAHSSGPQRDK